MLRQINNISKKLSSSKRTDVWEVEMLYKLVNNDLEDPDTQEYLLAKYDNPKQSFYSLFNSLQYEADHTLTTNLS